MAEAGAETRKASGQAEEMTEAVRGADVHLAGSVILRSGRVRVASQNLSGSALLPGISLSPVKAFFFVWVCKSSVID